MIMKKFIAAIILAALAGASALAQNSIVDNPDNEAYFGVRIGGDVTCPGNITEDNISISFFNNGGGIEFGGIYNVPLVANLYIEPGLKLFYDTYSVKDEFILDIEDDIIFNSVSFRKFGMRIPVMAGYHFDFTSDIKVYAFTGPELEIGFTDKEYIKGHNIELSGSVYGKDGIFNRANLLWCIGAGVSYKQFYFGINGGIGMLNMQKDSDGKFHENRVTFSVGYNF